MGAENSGAENSGAAVGADAAADADAAFAAVFDAAAEQYLDESTRIIRRGEPTPPLDEETRIVARPAAAAVGLESEPDLDESTRIVVRTAGRASAGEGTGESSLLDHRGHTPAEADDADTTNPGQRRAGREATVIPAPVIPAPLVPVPLLPPVAIDAGLASGKSETYPPRAFAEPPSPQRVQVEASSRQLPASAAPGATARRVTLTVLTVFVGVAALGVAILALIVLINAL